MGRKRNDLSNGYLEYIIALYRHRYTVTDIAISGVVQRYLHGNQVWKSKKTGRRRPLGERQIRRLRLLIRADRWSTQAQIFCRLNRIMNFSLSFRTLRRYCKRYNLRRRPCTKKQTLILRHRQGRLAWAMQRRFWGLEKWKTKY